MRRIATVVFGGLLGIMHAQVWAQTSWLCGLSEDNMRLVCVADAGLQEAREPVAQTVAVVNGTAFPLDPRRLYMVELLGPASDMEFVEQLARSTMCYRTPTCSVTFAGPRQQVALADRRP